jgi:hypothetical protein
VKRNNLAGDNGKGKPVLADGFLPKRGIKEIVSADA